MDKLLEQEDRHAEIGFVKIIRSYSEDVRRLYLRSCFYAIPSDQWMFGWLFLPCGCARNYLSSWRFAWDFQSTLSLTSVGSQFSDPGMFLQQGGGLCRLAVCHFDGGVAVNSIDGWMRIDRKCNHGNGEHRICCLFCDVDFRQFPVMEEEFFILAFR